MICPRNFLRTADSDIIVSLHLVIPFISMIIAKSKENFPCEGLLIKIIENSDLYLK
jgi:hypothetical protein